MRQAGQAEADSKGVGGLAGWLMARLRRAPRETRKLVLLEKMTLAPRQSLALIEAEGQRLLVATGTEGEPAIYALDEGRRAQPQRPRMAAKLARRISW